MTVRQIDAPGRQPFRGRPPRRGPALTDRLLLDGIRALLAIVLAALALAGMAGFGAMGATGLPAGGPVP